ncbi:Protein quiver [Amphibalanus amphitrite]|uniref:UPAR/Ly6 domain-containing protein qvr n=1 Tax=Amphibalanus amphitrite TaxID=1232801 RepID=A0A6A4VLG5_AMPAM|nr:Protein quiver [Amphibalanus amphitrite]
MASGRDTRQRTTAYAITTVMLLMGATHADGGCKDEVLHCYSCNSIDDSRCMSPFNYTDRPPTAPCKGWCVKIVENIDTEYEKVVRTCTDRMHINPFIVGNVCMEESSGHGSLCFCKKNRCNKSATVRLSTSLLLAAGLARLLVT